MTSINGFKVVSQVTAPSLSAKPKSIESLKYILTMYRLFGMFTQRKHHFLINILINMMFPIAVAIKFFNPSEKFEIGQFLGSLQISIVISTCLIKTVIIISAHQHIHQMEVILKKLDSRLKYPDEILEVKNYIKIGQRILILYISLYLAYTSSVTFGAILNKQLPYLVYIPFLDWSVSLQNYIIVTILEYVFVNISVFQCTMSDSYAVIYIGILNTHMKLLTKRIKRIGWNSTYTHEQNLRELLQCIRDHKNIISIIEIISPLLSRTTFVQFMVSAIALGISLMNITIFGTGSSMMGSALFILGVCTQILPLCYSVTSFVAESERLPQAIFQINWIEQSLRFRRICLFFMFRSQKAMLMSAGKILPISLKTFVAIVKLSFSLHTFLSTMDFGKEN